MDRLIDFLIRFWDFLYPVKVVFQYQRAVRYRHGKSQDAPLGEGYHIQWWVIDKIEIEDVIEEVLDLNPQSITTKDGVQVTISANIAFRIVDIVKRWNEVQDFEKSLRAAAMSHIARKIRQWTWEETFQNQTELERSLRDTMTTKVKRWGVEIIDVGIPDIVTAQQFRIFQENSYK